MYSRLISYPGGPNWGPSGVRPIVLTALKPYLMFTVNIAPNIEKINGILTRATKAPNRRAKPPKISSTVTSHALARGNGTRAWFRSSAKAAGPRFHLAHPWTMNPRPRIIRIGMGTHARHRSPFRDSCKEFTIASQPSERSRCTFHLDHPSIAITRAYQRGKNNWDFDPQCIERSSNAGGMDSLDTCNPSFQLNHVRRFQLCSIADISYGRTDLKRQCQLGDIDVAIDTTLTLVNVTGKVIVFFYLNGSTAQLTNCISQHILVFLVICAVLQGKLAHGFAHLRSAQFVGREVVSPNTAILKEKG